MNEVLLLKGGEKSGLGPITGRCLLAISASLFVRGTEGISTWIEGIPPDTILGQAMA